MRRTLTTTVALAALTVLAPNQAGAQPRWGRPSAPRNGACFYRDKNYSGDYFCVSAGEDVPVLPNGMNDAITSIRTFGNVQVTIFREGMFRGRSVEFRNDVRNVGGEWNDTISSLRVRGAFGNGFGRDRDRDRDGDRGDSGGRQPERRISDREAEAMVAKAYRSLLEREPDPASRTWVDQVKNNNWSEQRLFDEIKKSQEYISKHRRDR